MSVWVRPYCLVAGGMDSLTGLLLLVAPTGTLGLMGIAGMPAEPVYLRFIGVFVGAVGLTYFYPFAVRADLGPAAVRACLSMTALVRLCVALFVAAAIAAGSLEGAWVSVAATDGALALGQLLWLRSESLDDHR